jgi:hypothetical protein
MRRFVAERAAASSTTTEHASVSSVVAPPSTQMVHATPSTQMIQATALGPSPSSPPPPYGTVLVTGTVLEERNDNEAPADPMQMIKELKGLLDNGMITQQDYDTKKAGLLAKI